MLADGSPMQTRHRAPAEKYLGMVAGLTSRSLAKHDQAPPPAALDVDVGFWCSRYNAVTIHPNPGRVHMTHRELPLHLDRNARSEVRRCISGAS